MALTRPPLRRLQWLDDRLRKARVMTLPELQEEFEISERTARRDLEFLRDNMHAPVEYDRRRKGYVYTDPTFSLPAILLTEGELFALCLAEKSLHQYRGSPIEDSLRSAFVKLCAALPERVSVNVHSLTDALSFDSGPLRAIEPDIFTTLTRALKENRRLHLDYFSQSRREETHRKVDPYHLLNHKGDWYLIAHCHLRVEVRDFLVSRIRRCELTAETRAVPKTFDLEGYLHQSLGILKGGRPQRVRIAFDSKEAPYILERQWHPTQRVVRRRNGSLVLEFTVTGLEEVVRWVMSYGAHATPLAPKRLVDRVREEAEKILAQISDGQQMTAREE